MTGNDCENNNQSYHTGIKASTSLSCVLQIWTEIGKLLLQLESPMSILELFLLTFHCGLGAVCYLWTTALLTDGQSSSRYVWQKSVGPLPLLSLLTSPIICH